ncbi:DoxX family protein [Rhizobium lentis]|uniref:DoxX family protein n=1 Tax=Rhizobium lentis TaxID=1138194 RepID=UPI001C82DAF6|nr:DoxX family protein [Rhizobium lentis]MBX5133370.1 DoxX family protein [Rhizobium lentis]MBX5154078.1 DoxX family protein [Rhizobium lentis]
MSDTRYLPLAGRLLIGLPFLFFGFAKAATFAKTVALVQMVGIPLPLLGAIGAITLEIGGGLLLVAGYKVRPVAALLAIFTLVTAYYFHSNLADENTMVHFFKNVMMTGGLLQVVAFGAGALSLDAYFAKRNGPSAAAVYAN